MNVIRFADRTEQATYFNIPAIFDNAPNCNFKASSLLTTDIIVNFPAAQNLNDLLMSNYAIIRNMTTGETFFYWVTAARQLSGTQIAIDLELDVFNTYYLDVDFTTCNIRRACIDRFSAVSGSTTDVAFTSGDTAGNFLYISEDSPDPPLRMTQREKVIWSIGPSALVNNWISENVVAWIYAYVSEFALDVAGSNVTVGSAPTQFDRYERNDVVFANRTSRLTSPARILVAPIMKSGSNSIYIQNNINDTDDESITYSEWSAASILRAARDAAEYIYAIKFSAYAPIWADPLLNWNMTSGDLYIYVGSSDNKISYLANALTLFNAVSLDAATVCMEVIHMPLAAHSATFTTPADWWPSSFAKSDIIAADRDPQYNPKLYSSKYRKLCLSNNAGDRFDFDVQKMGFPSSFTIYYYESVSTPDITRQIVGLVSGLYTDDVLDSFTALITSADFSFPYASDALKSFLAQNKNFYEQAKFNALMNFGGNILGSITGSSMNALRSDVSPSVYGRTVNAVSAGASLVGGLAGAAAGLASSYMNMYFTTDNLENAPDKIKNANGNVFLNFAFNEFAIYIELHEILQSDQVRLNDYMCRFGYNLGVLGDVKDYDNIRHYYNYIEADIEEVTSSRAVSLDVRNRFVEAFNNGVRFWNPDVTLYDFDPENYENSIEVTT